MSGPSIGFRPDLPAIPGAAARSGRRELPAIASPAGRAGELSSLASVLGPQPSGELPALRSAVDPAADAAASWRDPAFGGALARARAERDARAAVDRSSDEYRTAREAAEQLVAEAFLKPLLALVHLASP